MTRIDRFFRTLFRLDWEIPHHVGITTDLYRANREIVHLQELLAEGTDPADRSTASRMIAQRMERQASHLENSALARAASFLPTPQELRAEALGYYRQSWEAARSADSDEDEA